MTKYYGSQLKEVIADCAQPTPAPVISIAPGWETNGVYHDIFFAPFSLKDYAPDYLACMLSDNRLRMAHWDDEKSNSTPRAFAWCAPAIWF